MSKLRESLLKFQSEVPKIVKDKFNPHFKKYYADLSSIIPTIQPLLTKCGLFVTQTFSTNEMGDSIKTTLTHVEGEEITSQLLLPAVADPQKLGSAITYYRRYQLCSMLNIVSEEDDDGNASSDKPENTYQQNKQDNSPRQEAPKQQQFEALASEAQMKFLTQLGVKYDKATLTKKAAMALIKEANDKGAR
jgi:hypothetical protein